MKNMLEQQFKTIFQREPTSEEKTNLKNKKIQFLSDFLFRYTKENFNAEQDRKYFDLLKMLGSTLQLDDEELLQIFNQLRANGITSLELMKEKRQSLEKTSIKYEYLYKIDNALYVGEKKVNQSPMLKFPKSQQDQKLLNESQKPKDCQRLQEIFKQCKPFKEVNNEKSQKTVYVYPQINFKMVDEKLNYKTILVIGQSGSGKSSFLEYLTNYYLGVEYHDQFRFILEKSEQSKNNIVRTYLNFSKQNYGLMLIDTPGLNIDINMTNVQTTIDKIFNFIQQIEQIDCICLILSANEARLTPAQNLLYGSILNSFGKQILPNLKFIFNQCCNEKEPITFQAMSYKQSQFAQFLNIMTQPLYFQVNCQNIFQQKCSQVLEEYYWNFTSKSMNLFYQNLQIMKPLNTRQLMSSLSQKNKEQQTELYKVYKESMNQYITIKQKVKEYEKRIMNNEKLSQEQTNAYYDLMVCEIEEQIRWKSSIEKFCQQSEAYESFLSITRCFIRDQLQIKDSSYKLRIKMIRNVEKLYLYENVKTNQLPPDLYFYG